MIDARKPQFQPIGRPRRNCAKTRLARGGDVSLEWRKFFLNASCVTDDRNVRSLRQTRKSNAGRPRNRVVSRSPAHPGDLQAARPGVARATEGHRPQSSDHTRRSRADSGSPSRRNRAHAGGNGTFRRSRRDTGGVRWPRSFSVSIIISVWRGRRRTGGASVVASMPPAFARERSSSIASPTI